MRNLPAGNARAVKGILFVAVPYLIFVYFLGSDTWCFFKNVYGIPCPACGTGRALYYLINLDLQRAFSWHPLFPITIMVFLIILLKKNRYTAHICDSSRFWIIIIVVFIVTWVIRMAFLFPGTPPMDFNRNSLLNIIVTLLAKF